MYILLFRIFSTQYLYNVHLFSSNFFTVNFRYNHGICYTKHMLLKTVNIFESSFKDAAKSLSASVCMLANLCPCDYARYNNYISILPPKI